MKKFVKMGMALALAAGMVGCSSAPADDSSEAQNITIGISPDYEPYESLTTDGEIVGFDVDMVAWFEEYLNENSDTTYTFEFVQMDFNNIITQIQGDQVDLGISGFTYDEERVVEWSQPYLATCQVAVVPAGSSITSLDDLVGKNLVAQTGATGVTAAESVEGANVSTMDDVGDIMSALSANQFDAAVIDSGVAMNYEANGEYVVLDGVLLDESNYIIAKEGNTDIIELIDECIAAFIASDDYAALCEEYGLSPVVQE